MLQRKKKTYDGATWIEIGFQSKTFFCAVDVLVSVSALAVVALNAVWSTGIASTRMKSVNGISDDIYKITGSFISSKRQRCFQYSKWYFSSSSSSSIYFFSLPRLHVCVRLSICITKRKSHCKNGVCCCCVNSSPCYNKNRDVYGFSDS